MSKRILILGANGFIGHHLSARILAETDWHVYGMDLAGDRLEAALESPRFHFVEGDITISREWVEYQVKRADVVLPLVAIATPATYVTDPLAVFELDFEANLPIVRHCVTYGKRLVFPSTSEVYGMCEDAAFDPHASNLVTGPIEKQRWIYSCAKQLLDRVIWAYGSRGDLDFTLVRPFNWIGPGLDRIEEPKEGSSRVVTQFLGHILRGEDIRLVDGGRQRRTFTDIRDGTDALLRILRNPGGRASGKIYNIGNPGNDCSVRDLAEHMIAIAGEDADLRERVSRIRLLTVPAEEYYGPGYQDILNRVPRIRNTVADLGWEPVTGLDDSLRGIFHSYRGVHAARELVDARS